MSRAGINSFLAFLATQPVVQAEEAPKAQQDAANAQPERICDEPANGARPGESLEARHERLKTALRLTEAEIRVNHGRARK